MALYLSNQQIKNIMKAEVKRLSMFSIEGYEFMITIAKKGLSSMLVLEWLADNQKVDRAIIIPYSPHISNDMESDTIGISLDANMAIHKDLASYINNNK